MDNIFYNGSGILSYNKVFNFTIGARTGGKTFWWKNKAITDFLKRGTRKIWVRREKSELSKSFRDEFFSDIKYKYPDEVFEVKETEAGAVAFINGELFIWFVALSVATKHKSIPYVNVDFIVNDEFIVNPNITSYKRGEVFAFMELYHTVARPVSKLDEYGDTVLVDPKTRCVFLGNSVSIVNPYFSYFNLKVDRNKEFNVFDNAVVEVYDNPKHREYMTKTSLGASIDGTEYGAYATHNEFLLDNDAWLAEKTNKSAYFIGFVVDNEYLGCWIDYDKGIIYVNNQVDKNYRMVAIYNSDHQPNILQFNLFKKGFHYKQMRIAFDSGAMRFNNHNTKNLMYDIMGMMR